jgi:hypothetical protein
MGKSQPKLNVVEPQTAVDTSRQALREAIERHDEISTRLTKVRTAQTKADDEHRHARDNVHDIKTALEVAEKDEGRFLAARALGELPSDEQSPVTKLTAQLQQAEAELASKEKLCAALAQQGAELEQSLGYARSRLDDAVIEALIAAPEVKRLFESYANANQSVVDIEAKISALPFGRKQEIAANTIDRYWFAHRYEARADASAAWRNACAALRENAGAKLPDE